MPVADRGVGDSRVGQVEALLAGEQLDTSGLAYDFDADHIGLIAIGSGAEQAIDELIGSVSLRSLVIRPDKLVIWCWLGSREGCSISNFGGLPFPPRIVAAGREPSLLRLAIGQPGGGLSGWRLSHHQARAALPVARRGANAIVRYSDVALLASLFRDDLLAASLRQLYLDPLEDDRDGGMAMRQTLLAYFEADRNLSEAGAAIGVTRQAVARRLRSAEEKIGRPAGAELELALRYEALSATPLFAP